MSSFDDCELEIKLYKQITDYLTPVPPTDEPEASGITRVKIHIAERLVLKFPQLGLKENRRALLLAIELKLKELREVILQDEKMCQEAELANSLSKSRDLSMLLEMGVISAETRSRTRYFGSDMDDDIPF